jgi:hypothetical protein
VAGGSELELNLGLLRGTLDAQHERGTKVGGRLLERERRHRRPRRAQVVVDRPLRVAKGPCRREMVRHVRQPPDRSRPQGLLERRPDSQVQLGPAEPAEPIVERLSHELVREAVCEPRGWDLLDHSAAHPFVERLEQAALLEPGRAPHDVERELGPGHARHLEHLRGRPREPGQSLADDLADALRARALRKGAACRAVPFTISRAPVSVSLRHSSIMRNALPSVSSLISRASSSAAGSRSHPPALADKLGDLLVAQAP